MVSRLLASEAEVTLVAPAAGGALLATRRPPEVDLFVPWDDVAVGALFGDAEPPSFVQDCDACIAISRSSEIATSLERADIRYTVVDPTPRDSHASEWYAAAAPRVGLTAMATPARLQATQEERATARALLDELPDRFLAIHPGAGSPDKAWPLERFVRVAADSGLACLWLKGPAESGLEPPSDAAQSAVADDLPLGVVLALLLRATAYLGNDSGISHLAGGAGTPSVVLFGPTDPMVWRPVGDHVRVLRGTSGSTGSIEVGEVLEALGSVG